MNAASNDLEAKMDENLLLAAFAAPRFQAVAKGDRELACGGMFLLDDYPKIVEALRKAIKGEAEVPLQYLASVRRNMEFVGSKIAEDYVYFDHAKFILGRLPPNPTNKHKLAAKRCVVAISEVDHVFQEKDYQKCTANDIIDRGIGTFYYYGKKQIKQGMFITTHYDGVIEVLEPGDPKIDKYKPGRIYLLEE